MITNILCSIVVSLVTNTTERVPRHQVSGIQSIPASAFYVNTGVATIPCTLNNQSFWNPSYEDDVDPKEKWVTTEIKKITIINNAMTSGPQFCVTNEVVFSKYEHHLVKQSAWLESPCEAATNLSQIKGHFIPNIGYLLPWKLQKDDPRLSGYGSPATWGWTPTPATCGGTNYLGRFTNIDGTVSIKNYSVDDD